MRYYKKHWSMKQNKCWYCNKPAPDVDHWPPRSVRHEYPELEWLKVRACKYCNGWLSNSMQPTLEARRAAMREHIDRIFAIMKRIAEGRLLSNTPFESTRQEEREARSIYEDRIDYKNFAWEEIDE